MTWQLWLELHLHFCMLSLLAVGGALAIVPEMHRYLVNELQLLSETAFSQSVTLSQIAPGPNILLVAVMGWNIGLQAAGGFEAGGVDVGDVAGNHIHIDLMVPQGRNRYRH
jgi:chromate transporter